MRALSDALPTGHRAMANPTLQLHFGCGRATPPVSHSHNWPSGRMQIFLFKIGQKSYFLPIKNPKIILTIEWYYRSMYCRSNAMIFFKMANLKAISSSATLIYIPIIHAPASNSRFFHYPPLCPNIITILGYSIALWPIRSSRCLLKPTPRIMGCFVKQ